MRRQLCLTLLLPLAIYASAASLHAGAFSLRHEEAVTAGSQSAMPLGQTVAWDAHGLIVGGRRVVPVMGEMHYSRVPADEWREALRTMKEGGITIVASYVFWNHVEEQEGIFRWDAQRDLRRFLEVCKEEQLPVVLRIGPFCHGEARCGGIPDWMFSKTLTTPDGSKQHLKLRSTQPEFLAYVEKLYRQIFAQVAGLQWKDGGPLLACQFDNEYRGSGDYLMALKRIALAAGFDLPFYTRTGWPDLSKPVPFGEMLPLYGDYADGFWDRSTDEATGDYYKAFCFRQSPTAATAYPYFTCELGGGMATAYHRRPFVYAEDAYAMALVKVGSGSNLLGYYMYHGGTNPESSTGITLNETQRTPGTAHNDLPVKSYDFQAPIGEYGQTAAHYYMLRPLHLFLRDYGEQLASMQPSFPSPQEVKRGDKSALRWAVRSTADDRSGFIFINNYERLQQLPAWKDVRLAACGVSLPPLTIPAGCMAILPVGIDGMRYATGQLVARRHGNIYMMQVEGLPTTICMQDGKTLKNLSPQGLQKPVYKNIYLLTQDDARHLKSGHAELTIADAQPAAAAPSPATVLYYNKVSDAGPLRLIAKGPARVAEAPTEQDWEQAAVYSIDIPKDIIAKYKRPLLHIDYRGDCARLYCDGRLVADHFQYGRPMLYGLWRIGSDAARLQLRILPMQPGAPVYLPREADKTPGEGVKRIEIVERQ